MNEKSRFLTVLLVLSAFLLNGCSIFLNESNKKYAFYTTEFENNPLNESREGLTYTGAKQQDRGPTNEYIVAGVFSNKRKFLRIMIPNNARGKEIKSSRNIDDFRSYCLNQTNEHAILDVISSDVTGDSSIVSVKPWDGLNDYIYPEYHNHSRDVASRDLIVFFNVYAGISGVLFKRKSDGELVLIPIQSDIEWKKRSRCNLFMRRSAYIITIPLDIVATPFYLLIMMTKGVG